MLFTPKKFYLCIFLLLKLTLSAGQALPPVARSSRPHLPAYVRIYPLELIVREARVGVEIGVKEKQSIVIDGSYFLGPRDTDPLRFGRPAVALKIDYRFYSDRYASSTRFFVGPNLMYKRGEYLKSGPVTLDDLGGIKSGTTDYRTVWCANVKLGIDGLLTRQGRSRYELFTGGGIRYQTVGPDYTLNNSPFYHYTENQWLPNLLLGVLLKF